MKIKTLNSLKYFLPATALLVVAFWGLTAFKTNTVRESWAAGARGEPLL